jgi:DNA-binding MarR family transcriptional regulator
MDDLKNVPNEVKIGPLLANIGRLHAKRADQFMEEIGLYRGQAFLLMILAKQEGLTHSEIAERIEISPAAATKVIKRMEALRYVRRQADPVDERVSRVYLEAEGWAVVHKARQNFTQIDRALVSNLSPEEQKTLIELLMKVYASLLEFSKV